MRIFSLAALSCSALMLAGCVNLHNEVIQENRQLDATTYEVELMQEWVKDPLIIREEARKVATDFCLTKKQGMQPLQVITRTAAQTGKGCMARLTYRCVDYMEGPKREYQPLKLKLEGILDEEDESRE